MAGVKLLDMDGWHLLPPPDRADLVRWLRRQGLLQAYVVEFRALDESGQLLEIDGIVGDAEGRVRLNATGDDYETYEGRVVTVTEPFQPAWMRP